MSAVLWDWISLLLRWAHVMLGILWIGTSFHFIWLDASLRREANQPDGLAGGSWMVHGGGFYHAEKYLVAPPNLPAKLHWFKYEAYFAWLSGFLLLGVVYYLGAEEFLIDPQVMALSPGAAIAISIGGLAAGWIAYDALCRSPMGQNTALLVTAVFALVVGAAYAFTEVFSGRAAFIHVGAFIGTIMTGNVFFIIIPNQKKTVAAMLAGEKPDPALGLMARQRSLHNNYLTLPVILMMVSNHYPMLYERANSWLYVAGVLLIGGLVRQYANARDGGETGRYVTWLLPAAGLLALLLIVGSFDFSKSDASTASGPPVTLAEIEPIFQQRCTACHSSSPTDSNYRQPPKGIAFDTSDEIKRYAKQIYRMAVRTRAMPLGNKTGMLPQERVMIGRWIDAGAGG
ncbi:MAG TPA: urate hydroxylase PuuD [Candidatus Udaeobacter sp.]|nr:urate hydroxylase PuuD [Candidatus Udaeobacter sp.]